MEIGNVILADGKLGVLASYNEYYGPDKDDGSLGRKIVRARGVYLDGIDFSVDPDTCILLDLCLNDYINRHVSRCGRVKIARKNREN